MGLLRKFLLLFKRSNPNDIYDKYGRCQFKAGQAIVFEPRWWKDNPQYHDKYPLKYGEIVSYIAEHSPAYGHCIVVKYDGTVVTMIHPAECRPATDDEV